jgi:crotonyl-CoA carboxylase/reductase
MYAWAIRRERHGPPEESMQIEVLPTTGSSAALAAIVVPPLKYCTAPWILAVF